MLHFTGFCGPMKCSLIIVIWCATGGCCAATRDGWAGHSFIAPLESYFIVEMAAWHFLNGSVVDTSSVCSVWPISSPL